ncbi:YlxR family protein [Nocardioides sp. TRM66260-LWL]|uniref:YlxR family protein n=1 Tax=Nocardioides sp. TRM66260-LWL TaxID=2874478 RepID=UPI001CC4A468|nr:YlxR family protein [Nocardioides sp. TRM66260-LWL]MBZ5734366.1 YlxR family protein [Nocardioides sp. TRM66260-LWL]
MALEPHVPARPARTAPAAPVRTCVGCRQRAAKRELLRVVAGSDAHGSPVVVPDPAATGHGRGAHLHPTTSCLELALRRKAFARALRLDRAPTTDLLAAHLAREDAAQEPTDHAGPTRNWSTSS